MEKCDYFRFGLKFPNFHSQLIKFSIESGQVVLSGHILMPIFVRLKFFSIFFVSFQLAAEEQELKELMAIQELLADEDEDEFNVSF